MVYIVKKSENVRRLKKVDEKGEEKNQNILNDLVALHLVIFDPLLHFEKC